MSILLVHDNARMSLRFVLYVCVVRARHKRMYFLCLCTYCSSRMCFMSMLHVHDKARMSRVCVHVYFASSQLCTFILSVVQTIVTAGSAIQTCIHVGYTLSTICYCTD
jgi:hypothetical protein